METAGPMLDEAGDESPGQAAAAAIARRFVAARLDAVALAGYPGDIPASLEAAYAVQRAAIARWPDRLVGWKVGFIAPERRDVGGDERLVGPIFARALHAIASDVEVEFPVFVGGFAAVEAELVFRIAADVPVERLRWNADAAAACVADVHIGIETAGSPLATINDLGPRVVISDFGNNAGMLLGPAIRDWRALPVPALCCETFVGGRPVGSGRVESLADAPLAALAFALGRCARNGFPLRAGDLVTTGALTGIHDIRAGETAMVDFGAFGRLRCRAVAATPVDRGPG